jgi:predicted porin
MNKNVLALAVAAIVGGMPILASANATIAGVLGYRLDVVDGKVNPARTHDLAVRGSEDLGNGLTGLYQYALTGVGITNDASFVGLRGGFGTVLMGRLDHPYRTVTNGYRVMGDTVATGSFIGERTFQTLSRLQSDNAIAYVSPNFSGFSFSAAVVPQTSATAAPTNVGGTSRKNEFPYSLSATYSQGPLTLNAAYEDMKGVGGANLYKIMMVGGRYTVAGLTIGAMGEERKTNVTTGNSVKTTRIIVPVTYALSPSTTLLASVMRTDRDQTNLGANVRDTTDWAIGVNYALSSRTSVRAAYAHSDKTSSAVAPAVQTELLAAEKDASGFSVFVRHAF